MSQNETLFSIYVKNTVLPKSVETSEKGGISKLEYTL